MSIERKDVENIAHLARLHLAPGDLDEVARSIGNILALIDEMQSVSTDGVAPLAHTLDTGTRLREDRVTEQDKRETLLALAPRVERGLFLVPKVIE